MNEINNSPACERAPDLIAFLYNEATETERRDFELHLQACGGCRQEVASFGLVRESITAWRHEALSGFVSSPAATTRKSATAALRQFFDLSPLWLKAATGFAVVAFCVLAALALVSMKTNETSDQSVQEALAKPEGAKQQVVNPVVMTVVQSPKPKRAAGQSRVTKSRRPLSRAEREQLAADLRLLSSGDDDGLNLVGDRINQ
jgi:anti-sigma factor RsiW